LKYYRATPVPKMRVKSPRVAFVMKFEHADGNETSRTGVMPPAHIECITIDFVTGHEKFDMDDIARCDWVQFNTFVSNLSALQKVVIGLRSDEDAKRYRDEVVPTFGTLGQSVKLKLAVPDSPKGSPFWYLIDSPKSLQGYITSLDLL